MEAIEWKEEHVHQSGGCGGTRDALPCAAGYAARPPPVRPSATVEAKQTGRAATSKAGLARSQHAAHAQFFFLSQGLAHIGLFL
jgi:hypothetical protein